MSTDDELPSGHSTGMDPMSKRFVWDTVLASFKENRGAILTTHSMEEADALCNRIGIMVKGGLRCLGTSQHLKNKYGGGYMLEIKGRSGIQIAVLILLYIYIILYLDSLTFEFNPCVQGKACKL